MLLIRLFSISPYAVHAEARAAQARAELASANAKAEAAEAGKSGKGKKVDKRKAGAQASRGADKLKKANTRGMAALSTFFVKKG
jgi:ribonuclease H2 subunit B